MQSKPRRLLMLLRLLRPLLHGGVIVACYYVTIHLRGYTDLIPFVQLRIPAIDVPETMRFAVLVAVVFLLIGVVQWLYELFRPIHSYYTTFLRTRLVRLIVSSFLAYVGFWFLFSSGISRFVLLWWSLLTGIVLTIVDTLLNQANAALEHKQPYRILLVKDSSAISSRVERVLWLYSIYEVTEVGFGAFDPSEFGPCEIVMIAGSIPQRELQYLADQARIQGKLFYHVSDTFFLEDLIAVPQRIWPMMALEYVPSPLDGRRRVVKRFFDIVVSLFALLVLSPVLLVVALAIKVDSPGPVLYRQKRVGKNKQPFMFIKFRSMFTHLSIGDEYGGEQAMHLYEDLIQSEANTRKGILPKIQDDPRVTRVGRLLRKTSLDELPSLFSVLRGTMSLVWPRPHLEREVRQYDIRQERLFSVKPGITGYAQLFGRDKLPFEEEARLDLYYIQNRSIALDLYVIVSTLKVVLRGR